MADFGGGAIRGRLISADWHNAALLCLRFELERPTPPTGYPDERGAWEALTSVVRFMSPDGRTPVTCVGPDAARTLLEDAHRLRLPRFSSYQASWNDGCAEEREEVGLAVTATVDRRRTVRLAPAYRFVDVSTGQTRAFDLQATADHRVTVNPTD